MTLSIFLHTGVAIGKVSSVIVNCSPLNLIVQCTAVWNVSIHTVIIKVCTYVCTACTYVGQDYVQVRMYLFMWLYTYVYARTVYTFVFLEQQTYMATYVI